MSLAEVWQRLIELLAALDAQRAKAGIPPLEAGGPGTLAGTQRAR
jgi:hypothetical protein